MLRRVADALIRSRSRLPHWVNRGIDYIADNPNSPVGRLAARSLGPVHPADIPAPTPVPRGVTRVFIGPTNYAGQGWCWARALEQAGGGEIGARNMAVEVPGGFSFTADTEVPVAVYHNFAQWQRAEYAAVLAFTHVLFEAERPLFGRLFERDVAAEARDLAAHGLSTAFMCHGTDIRLPSRHVNLTPWSPYRDPGVYAQRLEREATRNRALLDDVDRPTFVSTPDLLADVPRATWCPVVVEPGRWAAPALGERPARARPVVVHVPSQSTMKGTELIRPAMGALHRAGIIEYREIHGVPSARMPEIYAAADVVLDQFRLGSYGVAACEAMAAGRVVVGHVVENVRDTVNRETGANLPIVEATPDTVSEVVRALAGDPAARAAAGVAGAAFVRRVHDGARSARVLMDGWLWTG